MKTRYLLILALLFTAPLTFAQSTYNDAVVGYTDVLAGGVIAASDLLTYNRESGTVTASHPGQGQYTVTFEDVGSGLEGGAHVQVTNGNFDGALCSVESWGGLPDLEVDILCYDVDGIPVNERFRVLVLDEGNDTGDNPNLAFAWSEDASPVGDELDLTNSSYTHNPGGGSTTLFRDNTGFYRVVFEDLGGAMTTTMHVQVTPYSPAPRLCFTGDWDLVDGDLTVFVYCQLNDGSYVDSRFDVLVTSGEQQVPGYAYAYMDVQDPPPDQSVQLTNERVYNPFGSVTVYQSEGDEGAYSLVFWGLTAESGGNVVVTPYDINGVHCGAGVNGYAPPAQTPYLPVSVNCVTLDGDPTNARFTLLATFVDRPPFNNHHLAAFPLVEGAGTYEGTNVHATVEAFVPDFSCLVFFTAADVWWSFIASDDGTVTISTEGSSFDTVLSLNTTDGSGGFGAEIECNDDAPGEDWSILEDVPIEAGEEYLIRVGSEGNAMGNFPEGSIDLNVESSVIVADEATPEALEEVLSAPSPNPVRGTSTFTVAVENNQNLTVEVFDALGRRVQTLYDGALAAGMSETLTLDASALPAGVYVIRAQGEDPGSGSGTGFTRSRRVTVVR